MSNSPATDRPSVPPEAGWAVDPDRLLDPVRVLAFWTAITLPFLYLPLLATGLQRPAVTGAFVALLGINAVALFVGHPHRN